MPDVDETPIGANRRDLTPRALLHAILTRSARIAGVLAVAASALNDPSAVPPNVPPTPSVRHAILTAQIFDPTPAI